MVLALTQPAEGAALAGLPALTELERFPTPECTTDRLAWLYARRQRLEWQFAAQVHYQNAYTLALEDLDRQTHAWQLLSAAQVAYGTGALGQELDPEAVAQDNLRRRQALAELRDWLGGADWYAGAMPWQAHP
jgi:hypothetical protein